MKLLSLLLTNLIDSTIMNRSTTIYVLLTKMVDLMISESVDIFFLIIRSTHFTKENSLLSEYGRKTLSYVTLPTFNIKTNII